MKKLIVIIAIFLVICLALGANDNRDRSPRVAGGAGVETDPWSVHIGDDVTSSVTLEKDLVAGNGLAGGEDDCLVGADADVTFALTTWTDYIIINAQTFTQSPDGSNNVGALTKRVDRTEWRAFGRWSPNAGYHDYDFVVEWAIPGNFSSFPANAIDFYGRSNAVSEVGLTVTMYDEDGNADSTINGSDINGAVDDTWLKTSLQPGSSYTPGEIVAFKFHLSGGAITEVVDVGSFRISLVRSR